MSGSLRRLLHTLAALGLLTAAGAGIVVLSLRAGRVEPAPRVGFATGPLPAAVAAEAAADPGADPFTGSVATRLALDPALLPLPPAHPAALLSPHHPGSAADLAALPFSLEVVRRRDQGRRFTVARLEAVAREALGASFTLADLEDGDGDGWDDDGRATLLAPDGSAACLTLGPARSTALAQGLQADPGDGVPASGISWDPGGPCGAVPAAGDGTTRDGSMPGLYGGSAGGEVCDVALLVEQLEADAAVAGAWALVQGIDPAGIPAFAAGLTPVVLLRDTAAIDHGYQGGLIVPRRAVLQRGTAVLVDARGAPVARCASGSPLAAALPPAAGFEVLGAGWAWLDVVNAGGVTPATRDVGEFLLVDVETGLVLHREPGAAAAAAAFSGTVTDPAG
jgi:hypothetical protein